jgi:hypothetical protein
MDDTVAYLEKNIGILWIKIKQGWFLYQVWTSITILCMREKEI